MRVPSNNFYTILVLYLWFFESNNGVVKAWEWSDSLLSTVASIKDYDNNNITKTLSLEQISDMRVRDIKWRLARQHGYSAAELARMIDKKELIEALAFEEEKLRVKSLEHLQRIVFYRALIWTVLAGALALVWPFLVQLKEMAIVHLEIYADRKCLEARKCHELQSKWAMLGVAIMGILDLLQIWLSVSILLSWFMRQRNKFFFPIPNIPIRPAQFIGGQVEQKFGGYAINLGSMVVSAGLRFLHGRVEYLTGRAMFWASQEQRCRRRRRPGSDHKKKEKSNESTNAPKKTPKSSKKTPAAPPQLNWTLCEDWMERTPTVPGTTTAANDSASASPSPDKVASALGQASSGTLFSAPASADHWDFISQLNAANPDLILTPKNCDDEDAVEVTNMMEELD